MSNHATYPLETNGAVRHWLASGPTVTPIPADGALAEVFAPSGPPFGERGRWTLNYWAWDARVQAAKSRIYEALENWKPQPVLKSWSVLNSRLMRMHP